MYVGGNKMNVLPNAEKAIIPIIKFTQYALHPIKSKGKSVVFEKKLGYNINNANKLIENIRRNIINFEAFPKGDDGFGMRYQIDMLLIGENGQTANVRTGWIIDNTTNATRLTSAYIKKKGRR